MARLRSAAPITAIALMFGTQVACLEGFGSLWTEVKYDARAQSFQVVRELRGVGPAFFGCSDAPGCADAIERASSLASSAGDRALADRLAQRVADSGAMDARVELLRRGDALDLRVIYAAPVGSKAATDTFVHPEWSGRPGKERYRLVVDAEASMGAPPDGVELRKVPVDAEGEWRTSWVFDPSSRQVEWTMSVGEEERIFAEISGLQALLDERGLLGAPVRAEPAVVRPEPVAVVRPEPVAVVRPEPKPVRPEPVAVVRPEPKPVRPEPVVPRPEPAPKERPEPEIADAPPAAVVSRGVFAYPPKIDGMLPASVAEAAATGLLAGFQACFDERVAAGGSPEGYVFADARVRADGWVLSTSVYGEPKDPALMACLAARVDAWTFPAWPGGDGATAYVSAPFLFRSAAPPPAAPVAPASRKRGRPG
jgi:hypothetical protein